MKVLILSRKKRLYSTRRLREEVEKLGHDVLVLDPLKCVLSLKDDGPRMFYGPKEIRTVDLVFPRVGTFGTAYAISVVRHLGLGAGKQGGAVGLLSILIQAGRAIGLENL